MTKTKKPEPTIKIDANQTSSAAAHYGGVDMKWLKKIPGLVSRIKIPNIDPGQIANNIKELVLKGLRGEIIKEISGALWGWIKSALGKAKNFVSERLDSIVTVGKKIVGQWNTAEAQGLRLFGIIAGGLIGGATLLGAGPEVITGMLRLSQMAYTLNLNETDEQIDAQISGSITSLYGAAGEALGSGLASFVSGGVFRIPRIQINITKVAILWRSINEEARVQLVNQLKALGRTAFFTGLRMMVKIFYRDTRKWLKQLAKSNPNHPLINLIPGGAKAVELWGSGGEPWGLALYIQQKLENLQKNPAFKDVGIFLENFVQGFGEGINEFLPDLVRQSVA